MEDTRGAYRVVPASKSRPGPDAMRRPPCPYPGMVLYRGEDAKFFHGREDEVQQMLQLLRCQRFTMVIGPSGSGKSSLIYAGLVPALECSRYFVVWNCPSGAEPGHLTVRSKSREHPPERRREPYRLRPLRFAQHKRGLCRRISPRPRRLSP